MSDIFVTSFIVMMYYCIIVGHVTWLPWKGNIAQLENVKDVAFCLVFIPSVSSQVLL